MENNEDFDIVEILNVPLDYSPVQQVKGLDEMLVPNPDRDELDALEFEIRMSIKRTENNFLKVGEKLKTICDKALFKVKHYLTFDQYVNGEFKFSTTTAYRLIKCYEFINCGDVATFRFQKCNFSQMTELVTIQDPELLQLIDPKMSVVKMRAIKKKYYQSQQNNNVSKLASAMNVEQKPKPTHAEKVASFVETIKAQESQEILPLNLKNKKERLEFLKDFTKNDWRMIGSIQELHLQIFRRKCKNNISIVCFHVLDASFCGNKYLIYIPDKSIDYGFKYPTGPLDLFGQSENSVVEFLTKFKNRIE